MNTVSRVIRWVAIIVMSGYGLTAMADDADFDFHAGNAASEVVIPAVVPVIFQSVSQTGGDATLVLRTTTLIINAWFDASSPYHPTAVGVYSRLGRRPVSDAVTNQNINIALLYASYRVLNSLLPVQRPQWRHMLEAVGLDPENDTIDTNTPIGIGNAAGNAVVRGREHDGMNQLGDEGWSPFNTMPYSDYTGYKPKNSAYRLRNPSNWQPDVQRQGMGIYKVQQFVTPQYALTEPYSYLDPRVFHMPRPSSSNFRNFNEYKKQADDVLRASAELDDERKLKAELFDNKIEALGFSVLFAAQSQGLSLMDFIHLDFLTNMAAHDAGVVVWQEKRRFDTVRPFSAIRFLYGDIPVTAWGGPGKGTIEEVPAVDWQSYLEEADHPEYPSASTCFCTAHAQAARLFLSSDVLGWTVSRPAGSSRIEPGITPAQDTELYFDTWSDFASDCGQSRIWAGVHFQAAVDASAEMCAVFGDMAYDYLASLIDGTAAERPPARRIDEEK